MITENQKYCKDCGAVIHINAEICPKCGIRQMNVPNDEIGQFLKNKWLITLILCLLGGTLGLHNFYNKKIGLGILQLITFGGFGIWTLVDLILILMGSFKDKHGNKIPNPYV